MQLQKRQIAGSWVAIGAGLTVLAGLLTLASPRFGYDVVVRDMPVFWLTAGLMAAGALFLVLPWLVRKSETLGTARTSTLLTFIVGAGLVMRLILFASEPVLEDDYQRYLWDGAVSAHGLNPYAAAPEEAKSADPEASPLGRLAVQSGPVLDRVNHPTLRTIYPPVAQGAFALAHVIAPFSLAAWRGVILLLDGAALALLLMLLRDLKRSPLWASLYWWNPIVLKELFNSAHMDAIVVPLVLAGLVLAMRKRPLAAGVSILLAAGAKIWPLLLLPLVWRPLAAHPARAAIALMIAVCATLLFAAPVLTAGLDQGSGFVAFAQTWKTNSALFPVLEQVSHVALNLFGAAKIDPGAIVRVMIAFALGLLALWVARKPFTDAEELVRRALLMTATAFLLSPVQFPWYFLWVLPLLALRPVPGLLLPTATLPLYYSAFYFLARDTYTVFTGVIVWFIWIPVWALLLFDARHLKSVRNRWWRPSRQAGQPT
ncbi:MAG: glycosyltransferase 87 family protein [Hyphomicrobiales bacterium]|nr:glycosyltransferase 87 family protein [Hyphomicrobiales bacterium]